MNNTQTIKECRAEAKKNGLVFKRSNMNINNKPAYHYESRSTGRVIRSNLTLGLAYTIACSGELAQQIR